MKKIYGLDNKSHLYHTFLNRLFAAPQAKHVHMVAVGVGRHEDFTRQLEEIAGNNVHTVDNFDQLSDLFTTIIEEFCSKCRTLSCFTLATSFNKAPSNKHLYI